MKQSESDAAVVFMAFFGVLLVTALAIVWCGFWTGLTLSVLWGWFVVPLFGLPALTIWQAYGLALICFTLRQHKHKAEEGGFAVAMGKALCGPPVIAGAMLGVGWCVMAFG